MLTLQGKKNKIMMIYSSNKKHSFITYYFFFTSKPKGQFMYLYPFVNETTSLSQFVSIPFPRVPCNTVIKMRGSLQLEKQDADNSGISELQDCCLHI